MLIHELIQSKILPALRGIIAHRLNEHGISQRRIARYLEITQPMISRLLKTSIDEYYRILLELGIPRSILDHYVNILVDLIVNDQYERYITTSFTIINQLAMKAACINYKELTSICLEGDLRDPDIEYYRSILYRVLSIPNLASLIPEVGSNLAYAPRPPRSLSDIIGLTGRIVKSGGGVSFYGFPMYGGSRHVGRILLLVSKYKSNTKFCINIKYDRRILGKLESLGLKLVKTGPHQNEDEYWTAIENSSVEKPDVICDAGGLGLEPMIYIITETPSQLIELLEKIRVEVVE